MGVECVYMKKQKKFSPSQIKTFQVKEYLIDVQGYLDDDFKNKTMEDLFDMVNDLKSLAIWCDIDNEPVPEKPPVMNEVQEVKLVDSLVGQKIKRAEFILRSFGLPWVYGANDMPDHEQILKVAKLIQQEEWLEMRRKEFKE